MKTLCSFLLDRHLRLRPLMQARDVYKLLYQGVRGYPAAR